MSPLAWGRGLKPEFDKLGFEELGRPSRGGVD